MTTETTTTEVFLDLARTADLRREAYEVCDQLDAMRAQLEPVAARGLAILIEAELAGHAFAESVEGTFDEHAHPDAGDAANHIWSTLSGTWRLHNSLADIANATDPDRNEVIAAGQGLTVDEYLRHSVNRWKAEEAGK